MYYACRPPLGWTVSHKAVTVCQLLTCQQQIVVLYSKASNIIKLHVCDHIQRLCKQNFVLTWKNSTVVQSQKAVSGKVSGFFLCFRWALALPKKTCFFSAQLDGFQFTPSKKISSFQVIKNIDSAMVLFWLFFPLFLYNFIIIFFKK